MAAIDNPARVKHLYSRMTFGLHYAEYKKMSKRTPAAVIKLLFDDSRNNIPLDEIKKLLVRPMPRTGASDDEVRAFIQKRNQQERAVNIAWMQRLATTTSPLREKMTLLWHGHFACRVNNGYYLQHLNNIQRTHALGNFRTLLLEVSQSPAMLSFLNNQQNRKGHPNENFARELMELFTLGRGHYTEQDIRESARAFTGWQYRGQSGEFFFNIKQHDNGVKQFLGTSGNFQGEDIIDIILKNKQTARFVAGKVYRFFVNDVANDAHIEEMAEVFYNSGYEITPMLQKMLNSDWFYAPQNVANKIKSPVELITGLNRQFAIHYEKPDVLLQIQRSLGQALFYPPNVAGWTGGRAWIDSSSLMARMKLPSTLLNGGVLELMAKADPEDEAFIAAARKQQTKNEQRIQTSADWSVYTRKMPEDIRAADLAKFLLAPATSNAYINTIKGNDIRTMTIQLISSPEYQLC